jgi:lipoprotein NlpI
MLRAKSTGLLVFAVLFGSAVHADEPAQKSDGAGSSQALAADDQKKLDLINSEIKASLTAELTAFPAIVDAAANAEGRYSRRGDLHMFLEDFQKAEDDYQKMVTLKPELDSSHWRLGIAMYFAGHPKEAAAQFDKYHSFDNVDRENGIWRYLSHRKAFDREQARKQLLKYEKDDRPPFREVYRLFDGTMTSAEVLAAIPGKLNDSGKQSRLFYSHLYIGLNDVAEGKLDTAKVSLQAATLNSWPRNAGYGPDYMWHVGRLQLLQLEAK